jgi:hypothetical protein
MSVNIGINVVETDGTAVPALAGAATSVAGLLVRSQRGPVDRAVRVSSLEQFLGRFGDHDRRFASSLGVQGFFANGGQEAHVARVAGAGGAAASVTLKGRDGADTLLVRAGYRGVPEPGRWGNGLYLDVRDNPRFSTPLAATLDGNRPARLQGAALTGPVDLTTSAGANPRVLKIEVDSGPSTAFTVTFNQASVPVLAQATARDVAEAINREVGRRLVATAAGGRIVLTSRRKGATSQVSIVTGAAGDDETRTRLGFADGNTSAAGAAGTTAYGEAQVAGIAGLAIGDWVRLDDGISQDWRRVTGLDQRDDGAGNLTFFVRWAQPPEAERNAYRREDGATLSSVEFDLVIAWRGPDDSAPRTVETWERLSLDPGRPDYAPLLVNDAFSGSTRVLLEDRNPGAFSGQDVPAPGTAIRVGEATPTTSNLARVAGDDGGDPDTGDWSDALARFDTVAIQLLSVLESMPEGMLRAVTRAALDYCAGPDKGDCMFVGHTPARLGPDGAAAFGVNFQAAKVYGALYWPWIDVADPAGVGSNPLRTIPPTGHVLGIYARTEQIRGVWKAPAGSEALVRGALAVERDLTDRDNTALVRDGSVNSIRRFPGTGIVVDTSRTLSTDPRWRYVNVRLLFNYVKASLRDGLRWVKQEPNRDTLWNKVKFNAVTPFLLRLHEAGAFGTGPPAEVFTVVCGPENNPPDQVALGMLTIEVYFYPSSPAETIRIVVGQQPAGASAAES